MPRNNVYRHIRCKSDIIRFPRARIRMKHALQRRIRGQRKNTGSEESGQREKKKHAGERPERAKKEHPGNANLNPPPQLYSSMQPYTYRLAAVAAHVILFDGHDDAYWLAQSCNLGQDSRTRAAKAQQDCRGEREKLGTSPPQPVGRSRIFCWPLPMQ